MRLERPKEVEKARYRSDHDALSAMGKKGAEAAAITRVIAKDRKEQELEDLTRKLAEVYTLSPEGDVLPPELPSDDEIVH